MARPDEKNKPRVEPIGEPDKGKRKADREGGERHAPKKESGSPPPESGRRQKHENRENPELDHPDGHYGYNESNLENVIKPRRQH